MDVPAVTTDLPVQGHRRPHPQSPVSCANHGRLGVLRGDPHLAVPNSSLFAKYLHFHSLPEGSMAQRLSTGFTEEGPLDPPGVHFPQR